MLRLVILSFALIVAVGCQSAREKNLEFIRDRNEKLKPLARWRPTWCTLDTHLTQPAIARYKEMFPDEVPTDGIASYTWKAHKYSCEVTPLESSPVIKNQQTFIEAALCTLLQTHWVNSPFEELQVVPRDISTEKDGRLHIATSMIEKNLGIYLDATTFKMETHTKGRGVLKVLYTENTDHEWLPARLEQDTGKARVVVDNIEYDTVPVGGRRLIRSMWISVGEQEPYRHTQVTFSGCRGF